MLRTVVPKKEPETTNKLTATEPTTTTENNTCSPPQTFYFFSKKISIKPTRFTFEKDTRKIIVKSNKLVDTKETHERNKYYVLKKKKREGQESKSLLDSKHFKDITDILPPSKVKSYTRRMMLRANRILATAARIQMPRGDIPEEFFYSDQIDFLSIQETLQNYRNDSEENEPNTNSQGDFSKIPDLPDYEAIKKELLIKLQEAKSSCNLTKEQDQQLHSLCNEYEDLFRIDIGRNDLSANIPPYKIRMKEGAIPKRAKARGHSAQALQLLKETLDKLEADGLIYKNSDARWSAPVMLVPKPGKKDAWRLVIDLRYINHCSVPVSWEMPSLNHVISKTRGAKYFSTFDFCSGYWQVDVDPDSQEYFSFNTVFGCYTPRKLPQGHHASPLYFHSHIQKTFQSLIDKGKCLIWIDDVMIWGNTWEEYCENLKEFYNICKKINLKLSIKKSTITTPTAHWCGRDIDGEGVRYRPRNYETMEKLSTPHTAGELVQFVSSLTWMSEGLPRLAEVKAPLQDLLQQIYQLAGSTKKSKFDKIHLPPMWKNEHQEAFNECKQLLVNTMKQSHLIPGATLCMLTDASDRFYAALLTQVENWQEGVEVEKQKHLPIATLSGKFNASQLNWSTIEKEGYPIIEACNSWEYYLLSEGFRLYTDHANIMHLFNPDQVEPPLKRASMDKIHRWLLTLSHFHLISLEHLPGERNIWADLLSRWGQPEYHTPITESTPLNAKVSKLAQKRKKHPKYKKMLGELSKPSFEFPTKEFIEVSQNFHYDNEYNETFKPDGELLEGVTEVKQIIYYKEKLWIPSADLELQSRILVVAHCGECGHTGIDTTLSRIEKYFYWRGMKEDVANFVHNCLCCQKVSDGSTVPVPWGNTLIATARNEVLTFDYLYIDKPILDGIHEYSYILVLKDEFSGQVELVPAKACNHVVVAEAIAWWIARYGKPSVLRSDQGSHFKNKMIEELSKTWNISHHFTLPYTPWSNGSIEIVNKTIKRVLKTIILENDLNIQDWPYLLPTVQGVINGTSSERLDSYSPREVFMGLKAHDPFYVLFHPYSDTVTKIVSFSEELEEHIKCLKQDLDGMHQKVTLKKKARRQVMDKAFRKKHNLPEEDSAGNMIPDCDYRIGDYVLVAVANTKPLRKLDAIWRGPYRVVELVHTELNARGDYNNRSFVVEHLVTKERITTHSMRMKFFSDKYLDTKIDLDALHHHITSQENEMFEIVEILDYTFDNQTMQWAVNVLWKEASQAIATRDPDSISMEPLMNMIQDQPLLVKTFYETTTKNKRHLYIILRDHGFDVPHHANH
jgi:hypothetical protein